MTNMEASTAALPPTPRDWWEEKRREIIQNRARLSEENPDSSLHGHGSQADHDVSHNHHVCDSEDDHDRVESSVGEKDKRKGTCLYLGSAAVAVATGTYELSKGLPHGMLGLVANGFHEYSDALIRTLQGAALSARFSASRRLNKLVGYAILAGSVVTLGQVGSETWSGIEDQGLGYITELDPKPIEPHAIGMGGNVASGVLALSAAKHAKPEDAEHTREHVKLDLKKSGWLLAASATGVEVIDTAASLKLGVKENAELGLKIVRHADQPIEEIEDSYHHAEPVSLIRKASIWAGVKAVQAAGFAERKAVGFLKEQTAEGGERWRKGRVLAMGALAVAGAAGFYASQRYGASPEQFYAHGDGMTYGLGIDNALDLMGMDLSEVNLSEVPDVTDVSFQMGPEASEAPGFERFTLPEWNSSTGEGSIWGQLRIANPDLSDAEINGLAERALKLNGLNGAQARLLQPEETILMPVA